MSAATLERRNAIRAKFDATNKIIENFMTDECQYDKQLRVLTKSYTSGSFPDKVFVKSSHTGKIVCFLQDSNAARQSDFWDGELMEYFNMTNDVRLVLTRF